MSGINITYTEVVNEITLTETATTITFAETVANIGGGSGSGTVTSVAMTVPTGLSVAGSPVTSTGTLALTYTAGYVGYTTTEQTKLAGIETAADVTDAANVGAAGAFMKSSDDTDDITVGTINKFATAAEKTKLGHITITQAVDLDDIETRVNNLDAAVVLKGTWDASVGTFPGSGTAQAGASYIVSVAGTVDSIVFNIGDRAIAITDNASTTTYLNNWFKADYTDQVLSVNGLTGAVTLTTANVAASTDKNYVTDAKLTVLNNTSGTNSGDQTTIVGITGTKAQFNTAVSDGNIQYTDAIPCDFIIAASDETTALTTGTAKVTFRAPYAFTLTAVRASVTTAPTGGTLLTVDINESGTTVLSTKLTFDASEKTTTTATTAAVISDSAIADDAEITIDIDAVGSTIAGAGLKVYLIGTRSI